VAECGHGGGHVRNEDVGMYDGFEVCTLCANRLVEELDCSCTCVGSMEVCLWVLCGYLHTCSCYVLLWVVSLFWVE
jgi:hypothetical protein